jgi:hypothetical protein
VTGPEHYKQAEALLIEAARDPRGPHPEPVTGDGAPAAGPREREQMIATAHVHATGQPPGSGPI